MATGSSASSAQESPAAAAAERVDYSIAGIIGSQLSNPVTVMQDILREFTQHKKMSRTQMNALNSAMESVRKATKQAQQLSRLAEGRLRQSHERLNLTEIVDSTIDELAETVRQRGVEVQRNLKQVEVIVDPGLLSSLVEAAIEWALTMGRRLQVSLAIKNWPEHGLLSFRYSQGTPVPGSEEAEDTLGWHLLDQIARAMGVKVERIASPDGGVLVIEFPRTVKTLEGLTAVEVDAGGTGGDTQIMESKPLAGHRILLVTADAPLAAEVKLICREMGLMVDSVPTTMQAVRFVELDQPHLIIIDESLKDPKFDELREDLLRNDPNYPFVEIAKSSSTIHMASWMGDSISRVGRDALRGQLPSVIVMEMAKTI